MLCLRGETKSRIVNIRYKNILVVGLDVVVVDVVVCALRWFQFHFAITHDAFISATVRARVRMFIELITLGCFE